MFNRHRKARVLFGLSDIILVAVAFEAAYQTRILLTLVYAVILGPGAILGRLFGSRLLDLSSGPKSTWLARPSADKTLAGLRRQF